MTANEFLATLDPVLFAAVFGLGIGTFFVGYMLGKKIAVIRAVFNSST